MKRSSLPTYPSIGAAAGGTGIPAAVLKQAKRDGCPAFSAGNRVHLDRFLEWWFDPARAQAAGAGAESIEEAERRKAVADADLREIARAKAREQLIPVVEVERWGETVFLAVRQGILSATELTDRSKDEILENLQRLTREASDAAAIASAGEGDGCEAEPAAEADG
jgi:hypothetical protein